MKKLTVFIFCIAALLFSADLSPENYRYSGDVELPAKNDKITITVNNPILPAAVKSLKDHEVIQFYYYDYKRSLLFKGERGPNFDRLQFFPYGDSMTIKRAILYLYYHEEHLHEPQNEKTLYFTNNGIYSNRSFLSYKEGNQWHKLQPHESIERTPISKARLKMPKTKRVPKREFWKWFSFSDYRGYIGSGVSLQKSNVYTYSSSALNRIFITIGLDTKLLDFNGGVGIKPSKEEIPNSFYEYFHSSKSTPDSLVKDSVLMHKPTNREIMNTSAHLNIDIAFLSLGWLLKIETLSDTVYNHAIKDYAVNIDHSHNRFLFIGSNFVPVNGDKVKLQLKSGFVANWKRKESDLPSDSSGVLYNDNKNFFFQSDVYFVKPGLNITSHYHNDKHAPIFTFLVSKDLNL